MRHSLLASLAATLFWTALVLLILPTEHPAAAPVASLSVMEQSVLPTEAHAAPENAVPNGFDDETLLSVQTDQGVRLMNLHSYLTGVLLAEMPVSFEDEALKAQAVACRTYTLSRCHNPRHEGAAICTDSHCCQSWQDAEAAAPEDRERAAAAVRATDGLVLTYDGALIDATFFSCSGGRTEDAAAVWGGDLPYLKSVASPGEESASHYTDELHVPLSDFCAKLTALDDRVCFSGEPGCWVNAVQYTSGGGVDHIELGGCSFRGTALRKAFSLRSTIFDLKLNADEAVFTTRGNGHRVGLSQYGADAMARAGNDFETILKWYYQDVELVHAEAQ